jgi:acetyl-CoA carboxylase / biotin carboxylase 1
MADAVGGAPKVNGQTNGVSSYSAKFDLHHQQPHFIGGNQLSKAPPSKVKDFVAASDGHTVITNVGGHLEMLIQWPWHQCNEMGVLTREIRF